jgi:hypothetical protein
MILSEQLRDLGFRYVGAAEVRQHFDAAEPSPRRSTPVLEPLSFEFAGPDRTTLVDRFSLTLARDDVRQVMPETMLGEPVPTMFVSCGDLPPFTASGIDVEQLRFIP